MLSLTKAFEARNERLRNDEKGFTLIELLVVVIIIGILAAIAIPVFLGQQDKAKESATRADLANAKIFYTSSLLDSTTGVGNLTGFVGSTNSGPVTVATGASAGAFCLTATSTSAAGTVFKVTNTTGVAAGTC